ncbi:hypothetical protein [Pseudomonas triticifolii]|uniref:Lipoprotein n=1 Tax=Pseudomonas triticifolii TaxID=2762592 RepID=A0ABR7BD18_9PSED|nr:hypothetical protein [Pseudomonas triticifolii]MBC3955077.1 hypothetical protein [Pseudomonas triticifolii]
MRFAALPLIIACVAGCASTPDYYISPAPVSIPKTATYWVDSFKLKLEGERELFMSREQLEDGIRLKLIERLQQANRYASTKESADYLLDVDSVYRRRLGDSKGGLMSHIVDDNKVMASVDFGYQVSVEQSGRQVLHFGQERTRLQPGGAIGHWQNLKTAASVLTNKSNASVEDYNVNLLPRFIVDDIENIPSR